MIATIIICTLIGGYVVFLIYKDIKARKIAKKTGIPRSCCNCSSKNTCCNKKDCSST